MTNAQIIFNEEQRLAKEGIIKYTGKEILGQNAAGEVVTIKETEPIHTFAHWKALGFKVMKGEKSITRLSIWKHTINEDKETGEKETKMFLKESCFFSASQVEAMA